MKFLRKMVIFTMILAMPISSWASVMMNSHCQTCDNPSHSLTTQLNDSDCMHGHDQIPSSESNNQSNCECDDNMNCSVSGCSATALLNGITIDPDFTTNHVYQKLRVHAEPSDPDLLYRPPI